jgi:hypothetical protein
MPTVFFRHHNRDDTERTGRIAKKGTAPNPRGRQTPRFRAAPNKMSGVMRRGFAQACRASERYFIVKVAAEAAAALVTTAIAALATA